MLAGPATALCPHHHHHHCHPGVHGPLPSVRPQLLNTATHLFTGSLLVSLSTAAQHAMTSQHAMTMPPGSKNTVSTFVSLIIRCSSLPPLTSVNSDPCRSQLSQFTLTAPAHQAPAPLAFGPSGNVPFLLTVPRTPLYLINS